MSIEVPGPPSAAAKPFIEHIELENFGCYPKLALDLGMFNVLVGLNDSGKSVLLRALRATAELAHREDTDSPLSLGEALEMPRLRWAGAAPGDAVRIAVNGVYGSFAWRAESTLLSAAAGRWELENQAVTVAGEEANLGRGDSRTIRFPMSGGVGAGARGRLLGFFAALTKDPRAAWFERNAQLGAGLRSVRIFRLDPGALRAPSLAPSSEVVPILEPTGAGLATTLQIIGGAAPRLRVAIEDAFVRAVPTLSGFQTLATSVEGAAAVRLVFALNPTGAQLEATEVSDGALLFLAFLTLLHHPSPPPLLLIEEPENGVHPGRLQEIVKLLRRLTKAEGARPAVQIVMTTHSPYLLDEIRADEAYFCYRDATGAAQAESFASVDRIEERLGDYRLGELWTAYGETRLRELSHRTPAP
ncbi:MAG: AAA family ATPase [Myxococcales bacterium]|nr:AAA family ATPase [Myxococcales bacterium]